MTPQKVINLLAIMTLFTNIVTVVVIVLFLFSKSSKLAESYWKKIVSVLQNRGYLIAFLVSLAAVSGSLYFSEVADFQPCKLCWFQRIFMYPLPIILGVAIYKKLKETWNIVFPLALVGAIIAIYHYYFQVTGNGLLPCSTVGFSVSCSERFFTNYGYITIPWMSASAFLIVSLVSIVNFRRKHR